MAHGVTGVAELRRRFSARELPPVLYGCPGLLGMTMIDSVADQESGGRARG